MNDISNEGTSNTETPNNSNLDESKILFLSYSVYPSDSDIPKLKLVNQLFSDGTFKQREQDTSLSYGQMLCRELDAKGNELSRQIFGDPLSQNVEFVGDDGALGVKHVVLDSAYLNIRLQLNPLAKSIVIDKVMQDLKTISLTSIELN